MARRMTDSNNRYLFLPSSAQSLITCFEKLLHAKTICPELKQMVSNVAGKKLGAAKKQTSLAAQEKLSSKETPISYFHTFFFKTAPQNECSTTRAVLYTKRTRPGCVPDLAKIVYINIHHIITLHEFIRSKSSSTKAARSHI